MHTLAHRRSPGLRAGFTLVELMVVIMVLGILMAILLPALRGVTTRARKVEVRSEISALEGAIAGFKAEFGIEPPGSIRIYSTAAGWNTSVSGVNEILRVKSRAFIRQVWPQFDFGTAGGATGLTNPYYDLNGAECLVFFLGGINQTGFSKNPQYPFSLSGNNRVQPFFDFKANRLVDKDADTFREYVDTIPSQTSPYLYFSSNDGRGYTSFAIASDWANSDCFYDAYRQNGTFATGSWANGNWMKHMYFTTFAASASGSIPWAPKKFQIISPGFGGVAAADPVKAYGNGGAFNPTDVTALTGTDDGDNITNFHSGTLSGE